MRCSICQRLFDPEQSPAMPFCSERCHQVDLGRWLDERYGMPRESEAEEEATEQRAEEGGEEE
jgi:endogenous inhibitor of DNA gyrase (YacG/DUF329 family)